MIVPILLVPIAVISYYLGSVSTVNFTSNIYFHYNIAREFPRNNDGITRFMNAYRIKGVLVLAITEVLKTLVPVLLSGLVFGKVTGYAEVGYAFSMFCVLLGTVFPIMYRFKGEVSILAFFVSLFCINGRIAVFTIIAFAVVYYLSHHISLGAVSAAAVMCLASVLLVDDALVRRLLLFTAILIVIEHRKSLTRIIRGEEPGFVYRRDVGYIFDESGVQEPNKNEKSKKK